MGGPSFISSSKNLKRPRKKLKYYSIKASSGGEEGGSEAGGGRHSMPLAQSLLNAVADLLFCPEFTVAPNKKSNRDEVDDLQVWRLFIHLKVMRLYIHLKVEG